MGKLAVLPCCCCYLTICAVLPTGLLPWDLTVCLKRPLPAAPVGVAESVASDDRDGRQSLLPTTVQHTKQQPQHVQQASQQQPQHTDKAHDKPLGTLDKAGGAALGGVPQVEPQQAGGPELRQQAGHTLLDRGGGKGGGSRELKGDLGADELAAATAA